MLNYADVPKSGAANLSFRREVIRKGDRDAATARQLCELSSRDLLFWANVFCWTFNPRPRVTKYNPDGREVLPFVTWPFQDETLLELQSAFGKEDRLIEKSRDMGASWMILILFLHAWLFRPLTIMALISRKADLVDKGGDPDSLFWKLDFVLKNLPAWMISPEEYYRKEMHLRCLRTQCVMDGYSTTGDVLAGGRKTAALVDEFARFEQQDGYKVLAATQFATDCRFFNSTPQGALGAFYDMREKSTVKRITLLWTRHPEKAAGLFQREDGKLWSPWCQEQWDRCPVPALFNAEVMIDYAGSASMFFREDLLQLCLDRDSRPPYLKGRLLFDPETVGLQEGTKASTVEFLEEEEGMVWLWMFLQEGKPDGDDYVVGADISAGTGATNSVLSAAHRRTGEKVVEIATPRLSPDKFAELAVALCRWLGGAFLLWEKNGPGNTFGAKIMDLGYRNVYWRTNEQSLSRKTTDTPGWNSTADNKLLLFSQYVASLGSGDFVNRCETALKECRSYVYLPNGNIGNARAAAQSDPSGSRENHGDRPTADALACKGLRERGKVVEKDTSREIKEGSLAQRRRDHEVALKKAQEW